MRKILSVMLALAVAAMLAPAVLAVEYASSEETSFTIPLEYSSTVDFVPAEALTFEVTADADNPDGTTITVDSLTLTESSISGGEITVDIPSYSTAGEYNYTITEVIGTVAGVTYATETIHVVVLVVYDNDNDKLVIENTTSYIKRVDGAKTESFTQSFATGNFTVAMDVSGNMANKNDEFGVVVTLTLPAGTQILTDILEGGEEISCDQWSDGAYETTLPLSEAGGSIAFKDIPVGVEVAVRQLDLAEGYTDIGYFLNDEAQADGCFTVTTVENEVVITSEKSASVDVGVDMDNAPYAVLLVVAVAGAAAMILGRRRRA